jgi:hypothetical protein
MIFRFVLLIALKDKLYLSLLLMLGCVFGLSNIVAYSALSEEAQMQLVYFSFLSRLIIVCGMILFICFHINKSFENKEIEFILSKPISRNKFIFSYLVAFESVAIILLIPVFFLLLIYKINTIGLIWWAISIIFEVVLMSTFAITTSLVLNTAIISILTTTFFYFLSRMMGFFVYALGLPKDITTMDSWLKILSSLFPRLDLYGKTEWLIYGVSNVQDIYIIVLQSLIYIPLLLFISFHDFNKKQF